MWARELARVIDDPDEAARLRERAHVRVQAFGWSATVDRLLDVYADAVAERTQVPAEVAR